MYWFYLATIVARSSTTLPPRKPTFPLKTWPSKGWFWSYLNVTKKSTIVLKTKWALNDKLNVWRSKSYIGLLWGPKNRVELILVPRGASEKHPPLSIYWVSARLAARPRFRPASTHPLLSIYWVSAKCAARPSYMLHFPPGSVFSIWFFPLFNPLFLNTLIP